MNITLKNGSVLKKSYSSPYDRNYCLQVGSIEIPIEKGLAFKLAVENLPDDKITWHVNEEKGSIFFNDLYPEWSVVPNPSNWVAGNIYHKKRDAEILLAKALDNKINSINAVAKQEVDALIEIRSQYP